MKIGVFDSGVGGITVLSALRERLRFADFVYVGDTAHVPYGTKSPSQIEQLSVRCAQILKDKQVDFMVVACNTASSLALEKIQETMGSIPVIGMVEPGVQAVVAGHREINLRKLDAPRPILVLATRATIQSHAYGKALHAYFNSTMSLEEHIPPIIEQACPLLVPIIEEGWIDHPILHQTLAEYTKGHFQVYKQGIALLGCTHYPWVHGAFEKALPGWIVVNSAQAVVEALEKKIKNETEARKWGSGRMEWIFTDEDAIPSFARRLMSSS